MKSIPEIIICCGLVLSVMQSAVAADAAAASAPRGSHNQAVRNPTKVVVDQAQLRKRLEDRGIQAKNRSALAKQKDAERRSKTPAGN